MLVLTTGPWNFHLEIQDDILCYFPHTSEIGEN